MTTFFYCTFIEYQQVNEITKFVIEKSIKKLLFFQFIFKNQGENF